MLNHVLPQQDFFLYIPSQQQEQTSVQTEASPVGHDDWVEISIADKLVVYGRMWDEHEQPVHLN